MASSEQGRTSIDPAGLPEPLREIYEAASQPLERSSLVDMMPAWQSHVARVSREVPGVQVDGGGESLHLGELSAGCKACKAGEWDCIFVTMSCNLNCDFCLCPHSIPAGYAGSQFGNSPQQIAQNHDLTVISGISFSGGEPFLESEKLCRWVEWFMRRYPDKYYWLYTNGLLATEETLRRLADLGISEVRFNLAATGYGHPAVLRNVEAAVALLPHVGIEIPAIPRDAGKLLGALGRWSELGVEYLNLHELMYEPGSNSASMPGVRAGLVLGDGHRSIIDPRSRELTLAVMRKVQDDQLPIAVNDCSMQSKVRQLRGRRRCLAPVVQEAFERLVDGERLVSCCAFRGDDLFFFSPDALSGIRERCPDYRFVRLARTAPLSINDRGQWVAFEECD